MRREDLETIAVIKKVTGIQLRLRPNDEIARVLTSPLMVMVGVTTYDVTETRRETRFNKSGLKMYTLARKNEDSPWCLEVSEPAWDPTFQPYVFRNFGRTESPEETREREAWERDCYRPGTSRAPMDNYDRTWDDHAAPAMRKHFRIPDRNSN